MSELDKLKAKLKLAEYAESIGMTVVRDYGGWLAIGFSDRLVHIDEQEAKKKIEATIRSASKRKESKRARL